MTTQGKFTKTTKIDDFKDIININQRKKNECIII